MARQLGFLAFERLAEPQGAAQRDDGALPGPGLPDLRGHRVRLATQGQAVSGNFTPVFAWQR